MDSSECSKANLGQNETLAKASSESRIYVVATPIGNLADISFRAKDILSSVDLIAAEDTRQTRKLLGLLEVKSKSLVSYYDHIEESRSDELVQQLLDDSLSLALVSDAGTPCISDPGYRLVAKARAAGIPVLPVPGPSAVTALVSAAGLPCHKFVFVGFLPVKINQLKAEVKKWIGMDMPIVFFESARRIEKSLKAIQSALPDAKIALGRELTKFYEEIITIPISEAGHLFESRNRQKGEYVCMLSFASSSAEQDALHREKVLEAIVEDATIDYAEGASHKDLMKKYSHPLVSKGDLYALLLEIKPSKMPQK